MAGLRLEHETSANPIDASPATRTMGSTRAARAGNREPSIYVFASDSYDAEGLPAPLRQRLSMIQTLESQHCKSVPARMRS